MKQVFSLPYRLPSVTLRVRVWIETDDIPAYIGNFFVTLRVRVWIETSNISKYSSIIGVTLRVRVWIET